MSVADTIKEKLMLDLAKTVIDASLYWTSKDEEKNPNLKKARTLAGLIIKTASETRSREK